MKLEGRVKWYGVISACVFLLMSIYIEVAYVFSNPEFDKVLGYLRFTAGLSALIFGLLFLFKPHSVKVNVELYGVISACAFLIISTYMQMTYVFSDARVGTILYSLEITAALSSLIFGLLSFPKWQSFFALAVWLYSFYRFSQPPFAIS